MGNTLPALREKGKRMRNRDFRIAEITRKKIDYFDPVFEIQKGLNSFYRQASLLAYKYNSEEAKSSDSFSRLSSSQLNASAVLHLVYQVVLSYLLEDGKQDYFTRPIQTIENNKDLRDALSFFSSSFPTELEEKETQNEEKEENLRSFFIYELLINNPALLKAARPFLEPKGLKLPESFKALSSVLSSFVKDDLRNGEPNVDDLFTFLNLPSRLFPNSLTEQITFILKQWKDMLPLDLVTLLENSLDYIKEETKDRGNGAPGPYPVLDYSDLTNEYEAFSDDSNWMPRVIMMAKSTLVWLDQLSKEYKKPIQRLDQIPDKELDLLKERGFTALWLIGLWQRSKASAEIKHLCGNPDAVASAYSLKDYEISSEIGGWEALENLKRRCSERGIRLASDMVPNHTGLDGTWVYEHPDYYISQDYPPFPNYTYTGVDLSTNPDWEIKIEDHYYDKTDAAVTFRLINKKTGEVRYVFHGNDGTTMPWNDTAQLDYLNPVTREAVIQKIIHVAKTFPIIRFDAAMTLAKRHIERLWYPKPGTGGDIAGRASHSMSSSEFNQKIPEEFWREVVDRIATEVPDTLLLAEAFWMMEGYFVRTLGMHRVYNSAFMNMLKNQENQKYRQSIKNTLAFEPEILKRYVNFMNNPDEETAIAQFGDGDRYFAIATLLATLPGLPMIGHGQIEGYKEKYGMEYQRAYYDEKPNERLIHEHYRRIFPLFKKRYLFSGVEEFNFYDSYQNGFIEESVYAFVNGANGKKTLVLVNNQYERVEGNINISVPKLTKTEGENKEQKTVSLAEDLGLHFSSSFYVLFDNFSDGNTYILPSINLFDYGFNFTLNGYEARVFWNIREVEDNDGCYEKLWNEYREQGISDLETALTSFRLKPIYSIFEKLRSTEVGKIIDLILNGQAKKKDERQLLFILAEIYSRIYEVYPSLEETTKALIGDIKDINPQPVITIIQNLTYFFSKEGPSIFTSWDKMNPALSVLFKEILFLVPFTNSQSFSVNISTSSSLLLPLFFEKDLDKLSLNHEEREALTKEASLFLSSLNYFKERKDGGSPIKDSLDAIKPIINKNSVMEYLKCNEWDGEIWYNKERMQSLILLLTLSYTLTNKEINPDIFSESLLKKELDSAYKLRLFLQEEKDTKKNTPKRQKHKNESTKKVKA